MSIFNQNINNCPLEKLLETVERVVDTVIPWEMMHYNVNPNYIACEISRMFEFEKIWYNSNKPYDNQKYTIYSIEVQIEEYKRGIPFYKISLWLPELDDHGLIGKKYFIDLFAGIGGVVHERL